jgi:hypothetical protein
MIPNSNNLKLIGAGGATLAATPAVHSLLLCTELDWVLVRLIDRQFFGPNLVQAPSGETLSPQEVSITLPHGKSS